MALLQRTLGSSEKDLERLLDAFFDTDDSNFYERYQVFYRDLAPLLQLYRLKVGDILTITAFTRSGYVQSSTSRSGEPSSSGDWRSRRCPETST